MYHRGLVLGLCLFLFYINDIAQDLHSTARLFADDTMIYLAVNSEGDTKCPHEDLDTLACWEKTWMMEFNPEKCEVISITRSRNLIIYPYTLHGHTLKHTDTVKYLGVKINKDLRWDQHVNMTTHKANNSLNFLRRNIKIGNPQIKEHAYKALVCPILEYSHTVWDPHTTALSKSVESV